MIDREQFSPASSIRGFNGVVKVDVAEAATVG